MNRHGYDNYGHKIRDAADRRISERGSSAVLRPRGPPRRLLYVLAAITCIVYMFWTHSSPSTPAPTIITHEIKKQKSYTIPETGDLPCRNLPGANDTLVIMKTGGTELAHKLPVHLNSTLRCYPNSMIFSDYEEDFQGFHIYDALESVNDITKSEHPDFELWRRMQTSGGRRALLPHELSGRVSPRGTNFGKNDNPGWRLDKWKFLPMINRTLHEWPDKKWYIFLETDTFVHWQTLLNYLAALDSERPYYIGGPMWIGDIMFAHGGTGYVISKPALENVVRMFNANVGEWEWFTNDFWAGDGILGKAMADSGTNLTQAWPIFQGSDIGAIDWNREEGLHRLWCAPTVSYHHLAPSVVEDLWRWEMDWLVQIDEPKAVLHHHDMYAMYLLPRTFGMRKNWDNGAADDYGPVEDLEACRDICQVIDVCTQYSLSINSRCTLSKKPQLGEMVKGVESGWIPERMKKFLDDQPSCRNGGEDWIVD